MLYLLLAIHLGQWEQVSYILEGYFPPEVSITISFSTALTQFGKSMRENSEANASLRKAIQQSPFTRDLLLKPFDEVPLPEGQIRNTVGSVYLKD